MSPADLSVRRPIFISCIVILMLALGWMSMQALPVDLFPDVTFPVVMVQTPYPGAGPVEVETLVSKVLEDEMSTLPGIKRLSSINKEGISTVVAEFTLETDVKYAEQQVRDRVSSSMQKLPTDVKQPMIRKIDPADQPIAIVGMSADLPPAKIFDLADQVVKPKLEQVAQVGLVEIIGGRKREIQVQLDRGKLKEYELSATQVSQRIASAGQNIPAGKVSEGKGEVTFRTLGEFKSLSDIEGTIVNFLGNDVPVTLGQVARVKDGLQDETSRAYVNGEKSVFLMIFRQSGANTIAVVKAVKDRIAKLQSELDSQKSGARLTLVRDTSRFINMNVEDVKESILLGVLLTVIVVYFFLGSGKSTIITGLAIPNSLIGAFMLMRVAGFSINIMSLLALSLAVGLLIDDAIVVRENIFRHIEMGKKPIEAALVGAKEVTLAVIATSLTVIAVFGPIGFLQGVVGQFFKQFGLTVCFAMIISLFDALTIAPMLSAYYAGSGHGAKDAKGIWGATMGRAVRAFDSFQSWLEDTYEKVLRFSIRRPMVVLVGAVLVFLSSLVLIKFVPKTFLPPQDAGEFSVALELPPGSSLDAMNETALQVDRVLRDNKEIRDSVMFLGSQQGESNVATFFINMIPSKERKISTTQMKDKVREELKPFAYAKPIVKDIDAVGGGQRPFNLNIIGTDLPQLEKISQEVFAKLKNHPGLKDPEISDKPGKPELQVSIDNRRAESLGVSTSIVGLELRTLVEGMVPAVFREGGEEYDIRVRLQEDQRDLGKGFGETYVPNINQRLIRLDSVAKPVTTTGPATINRQDRGRYIQIGADIAPNGPGMGGVMADIRNMFENEIKLPQGMRYQFQGQAENFQELGQNMAIAAGLGVLFIFLVLASLYESFITPFTIMLVLPLASAGAFLALLITQSSLDLFSMIGCIMLLGISTKNSILLVDYTNQLMEGGMERSQALITAGRTRLRPILMTTIALIAGMSPIAIGLNEASKQRTSMGIAVIGGLISSTLLTLVVVPASFTYIDRFRIWITRFLKRWFAPKDFDLGELHESRRESMPSKSVH